MPVLGEAFYGDDALADDAPEPGETRFHGLPVHQNRACRALTFTAAVLGPGEVEIFAENAEQSARRLCLDPFHGAVDINFRNSRHETIVAPKRANSYAQSGQMVAESRILEALFPGSRRTIFVAVFTEPQRWWTLEELAGRAGVLAVSLQPHVLRLRDAGVIREQRADGRARFQVNPDCPVYPELMAIVRKLTPLKHGETILVVEDTAATARITRILLESWGYRVLEAHTPTEAMVLFDAHGEEIELLLTDVMMPCMTGTQLATELRRLNPKLRVVYMSGYSETELNGTSDMFLAKPFNPTGLAQTVRRALDSPSEGRGNRTHPQ